MSTATLRGRTPGMIQRACSSHFAHEALDVAPNLVLLLPCNDVAATAGDRAMAVSVLNGGAMLAVVADPALYAVAGKVNRRFERALQAVASS